MILNFETSSLFQRLPRQFFASLQKQVGNYRSQGVNIIDLSIGNPDLPTPPHIVQRLKEAVDDPQNHRYQSFDGKPSTLEAIAAFYQKEYGVSLDPHTEISIFHGSGIGILAIPQVLLNPGDVLLTTDPCYPPYHTAAVMAGASIYTIPLREEDGYLPNYDTVPQEILSRVKLLVLNYPNNPTGAVATSQFFEQSLRFAETNHFPVVNDFAYAAFGFDGHKPVSLLQTPGSKEFGVEVYTASKTWNMAGWRFGFAVGNASVIEALKYYHNHAYSSVFGAVQDAAAAALLGSQDSVRELAKRYEVRRNLLISELRKIGWEGSAPSGTFYIWLKVPCGYDSVQFAQFLLDQAHVAVAPGEGFGSQGREFVRISLTNSEEQLTEAVERIAETELFHTAVESGGGK